MQLAKWKRLLILTSVAISTLGATECQGNAPEFDWHPKFWVPDAQTQTVVRKDESGKLDVVSTANSRFNEMICTLKDEPRKALDAAHRLMNACKTWKSPAEAAAAMGAVDQLEQEVMEQVDGKSN